MNNKRERKRVGEMKGVCVCVCVRVRACERDREREKMRASDELQNDRERE